MADRAYEDLNNPDLFTETAPGDRPNKCAVAFPTQFQQYIEIRDVEELINKMMVMNCPNSVSIRIISAPGLVSQDRRPTFELICMDCG